MTVRTVLGDVGAGELGRTYAHEHLIMDNVLIAAAFGHIHLPSVQDAVTEVGRCAAAGVATMVDAMPCCAGRDVQRLAQISERTGVHVIAVTGLHHERYYGPTHWTARVEPDVLAGLFITDVTEGVDAFDYTGPIVRRTPHRAGMLKIATGGPRLDARDELLIEAAAIAHQSTGAPVLTHCEGGTGALEQIEALARYGVPADAVLCSHVDKVADAGYHREIARSGAYLEYDQSLRHASEAEPATVALVQAMLADGYRERILLGTDGARRSLWRALGGSPGLDWLATGFRERLAAAGVTDADLERLYVTNPARALALRTKVPQ